MSDASYNTAETESDDIVTKVEGFQVTLEPGDILYVPRTWWHFVSNTSPLAISVNTWVECPWEDARAQVHEALVRVHAARTASLLGKQASLAFLNPNEDDVRDSDVGKLEQLIVDLVQNLVGRVHKATEYPVVENENWKPLLPQQLRLRRPACRHKGF